VTVEEIFEIIARHARDVLPGLKDQPLGPADSLRELGANSIDRSEIVMLTLESLSLKIPLVQVAKAENMGELASLMHARL
jgi:polyketide biosynthesis acyl carrier protein